MTDTTEECTRQMFKHHGCKGQVGQGRFDENSKHKFSCSKNDVLTLCFSSVLINVSSIRILGVAVDTAIHITTNTLMKEESAN